MTDEKLPHTKVVATIGPASEGRIGELIDAGLSVARLNMSHGTHDDHRRRYEAIRRAAEDRDRPIGVLVDISGPKMRLGFFPGGEVALLEGERVRLVEGDGPAKPGEVPCAVPGVLASLEPGHRALLADGGVELVIESRDRDGWAAVVRRGGTIGDRKGVHLPDTPLDLAVPTEKDEVDLALCRELGVDLVGASFVSRPEELRRVRELAPEAMVVAKIERKTAWERIDELLPEAHGAMVARGDLGVEMELEELPMIQKSLIDRALQQGLFVITATEMLESMVHSSRPTRAEVADVANAIFDGTDALMLSAETAVGLYPVEAVRTMVRIATAVERSRRYKELPRVGFRGADFSNATSLATLQAAEALGLRKIVCFTETGSTARQISRYRPTAEVVALTPNPRTLHGMTVLAHVRPFLFPRLESLEEMLDGACGMLVERGLCVEGEEIVFVAGVPPGVAHSTNVMKLHRVGETVKLD